MSDSLYTVVVADDEEELRESICEMIPWEEIGFRLVGSASNGLDALEMVEACAPDLLLTDIRMPFISGIELARQIREIRPSLHVAFLSGFDDFSYAQQAIQYNIISYMLKPISLEDLKQELIAIKEKIDNQFETFNSHVRIQEKQDGFLNPLVLDAYNNSSDEELVVRARECGFIPENRHRLNYVVMVTTFLDESNVNYTDSSMVNSVNQILKKYLIYHSFFSNGKVVSILAGDTKEIDKYLHILADELIQNTDRIMQMRCHIGLSHVSQSLAELHLLYQEAMEAHSFSKEEGVRYISDMRPLLDLHDVPALLSLVENAVKNGEEKELEQCMDKVFASPMSSSRQWLDIYSLQLVAQISRLVYAGEINQNDMVDYSLPSGLGPHYTSEEDIHNKLLDYCKKSMEILGSRQKQGGSLLCDQALELMNKHYSEEDLSLVRLSSMLHVSPNYLSASIKKYAGETFISILTRMRMEKANELILTTSKKILEIAMDCGYADQRYFSYCFKKYFGMSPNAKRRERTQS